MSDTPLINGIEYDYASIEININGEVYRRVTAITYKHALTPGKLYGTHPQAQGRTTGKYEPEASMTLAKDTADMIRQALGSGYMTKQFDIVVSYAPSGQAIITDKVLGCRITDESVSNSEGTDGLVEEWTLDPWRIAFNGLDPLSNMF